MLLVFSTTDFKVNNIPYEGFPIILDDTTGQVHEPALNFLIYYCIKRGRCQSVKSWKPYGQAMYDYLSFLQANNMDWREFYADGNRDSTIIANYRDWSLSECGLSAVTINQRLRVIVKFYQYALRHDWIASLPYLMEEVFVRQPKGFLAHVNSSGGVVASGSSSGTISGSGAVPGFHAFPLTHSYPYFSTSILFTPVGSP